MTKERYPAIEKDWGQSQCMMTDKDIDRLQEIVVDTIMIMIDKDFDCRVIMTLIDCAKIDY